MRERMTQYGYIAYNAPRTQRRTDFSSSAVHVSPSFAMCRHLRSNECPAVHSSRKLMNCSAQLLTPNSAWKVPW